MPSKFILPMLLCCLLSVGAQGQKYFPTPKLMTVDRQPAALDNYVGKGKPTVISMWATWCGPCKTELDHMKPYLEKWEGEYDVNFLAISVDQRHMINRIKPMVQRQGWKYKVLVDPNGKLQSTLGFDTIPTMYVLDGNGKIVRTYNGYVKGQEHKVDQLLRRLSAK